MRFSTQEEFGLRCLLQLARNQDKECLTIPQISAAEGISSHNVAKMMRLLRKSGLVQSVRGQSGGYKLSRPASQIRIGEILDMLGGPLFGPRFCKRYAGVTPSCFHSSDCSIRILWQSIQAAVNQISDRISLEDLLGTEKTLTHHLEHILFEPQKSAG